MYGGYTDAHHAHDLHGPVHESKLYVLAMLLLACVCRGLLFVCAETWGSAQQCMGLVQVGSSWHIVSCVCHHNACMRTCQVCMQISTVNGVRYKFTRLSVHGTNMLVV